MTKHKTLRTALLAAAGALAVAAPPASAGQFNVDHCRDGEGAVTGIGSHYAPSPTAVLLDDCSAGSSFHMMSSHAIPAGQTDYLKLEVPSGAPNTSIESVYARFNQSTLSMPSQLIFQLYAAGGLRHQQWSPGSTPTDITVALPPGTRDLYWVNYCLGPADCVFANGYETMNFFRVRLTAREDVSPSAETTGGSLLDSGARDGIETLAYDTADADAGVQRIDVKLGDVVVATKTLTCSFSSLKPCPSAGTGEIDVDTTVVPDGDHPARLVATDGAGNLRSVNAGTVKVDNVPPPAVADPDGVGPSSGQPSILGTAKQGNTLIGDRGTWSGDQLSYGYRWMRCDGNGEACSAISGATQQTYEVVAADVGRRLRFEVTATNAEGSASATSAPTQRVVDPTGVIPPCTDQPTGPTDPCGDFDGDGIPNQDDADADGDGSPNTSDLSPFDPAVGGAGGGGAGASASGGVTSGGSPAVGAANNGTNASNRAQISVQGTRRRRVAFGRRIATVAYLRDENGRPIAGGVVTVMERMNVAGAAWVPARDPIVSDSQGRLRWIIPAKHSRTIRYGYKANLANAEFQSTSELVLTVSSKSTLKSSRRVARNGQTVAFRGALKSRPIPRGGVLIDLQAKVGSRWQTFKTARAKGRGRWKSSYRFRATSGTRVYAFRARVRQDSGFPYALSTTRAIKVKVKG